MKTSFTRAACTFALAVVPFTAIATLIDSGDGLILDTDLNISWLKDANLAASNTFGISGIATNGTMNWSTAQNWITAMNAANYLGYNDWRLPTVTDTGAPGCDFSYTDTDCGYNSNTSTGEMAHLFFDELGNTAFYNTAGEGQQVGYGLTNTGPFTNFQNSIYWSGTENAADTDRAWSFYFDRGAQSTDDKTLGIFALAVRPTAVPIPPALWLFGSGLLC